MPDFDTVGYQQELLAINSTSYSITHRATLPHKASGARMITSEAISLDDTGSFLLAASSKGVRMYLSKNLMLLGVFGEGLALHGHTLNWQDCMFALVKDGSTMEEREDELVCREGRYEDNAVCGTAASQGSMTTTGALIANSRNARLYVIGVPHAFREPLEMRETIHFWDATNILTSNSSNQPLPELATVTALPTMTIKAPEDSLGIQSLLYNDVSIPTSSKTVASAPRLILTTMSGDCQELERQIHSDWAGNMYPPGYKIVNENIEYIEDEDELDYPVDEYRVYKRVMEEQEEHAEQGDTEEEIIDVVNPTPYPTSSVFLPCHPEPFLQEKNYKRLLPDTTNDNPNDDTNYSDTTDTPNNRSDIFLNSLPPIDGIMQRKRVAPHGKKSARDKDPQLKQEEELNTANTARPVMTTRTRGKRPKTGSLEAVLQASIDNELRNKMLDREAWVDGYGSCFVPTTTKQPITTSCSACLGRMVYHSCSRRIIPEDHELIAKLERETQEAQKEAERQKKLEKKRAMDRKRRETARKKKQEEVAKKKQQEKEQEEEQERLRFESEQQQEEGAKKKQEERDYLMRQKQQEKELEEFRREQEMRRQEEEQWNAAKNARQAQLQHHYQHHQLEEGRNVQDTVGANAMDMLAEAGASIVTNPTLSHPTMQQQQPQPAPTMQGYQYPQHVPSIHHAPHVPPVHHAHHQQLHQQYINHHHQQQHQNGIIVEIPAPPPITILPDTILSAPLPAASQVTTMPQAEQHIHTMTTPYTTNNTTAVPGAPPMGRVTTFDI